MKFHAIVLALLVPRAAAHADAPDLSSSQVSAVVGVGAPLGGLGIEYAYAPAPSLELSAGIGGANLFGLATDGMTPDVQAAVMPRYRLPVGPVTITAGVGLSAGRYTVLASPFSGDEISEQTTALWLNGELGAELRGSSGWFGRVFAGYGQVIAHSTVEHDDGAMMNDELNDDGLPYAGISVGRSF